MGTDFNEGGMEVDKSCDKSAATDVNNEFEQDKENKSGSDGLNSDEKDSESEDSFGVNNKREKKDEKAGAGSQTKNDKMLSEETQNAKKLDILNGLATEESLEGEANIFQHVNSEQDKDRSAIDKAKNEERNDEVIEDIKDNTDKDTNIKTPEVKEEQDDKKYVSNDQRSRQSNKQQSDMEEDEE